MVNESLIGLKGKPNTKYEGKNGTAPKMRLFNTSGKHRSLRPDTPILVLWNGDKEKEPVMLKYLDIIEIPTEDL